LKNGSEWTVVSKPRLIVGIAAGKNDDSEIWYKYRVELYGKIDDCRFPVARRRQSTVESTNCRRQSTQTTSSGHIEFHTVNLLTSPFESYQMTSDVPRTSASTSTIVPWIIFSVSIVYSTL
jgi:hypothetical protein